MHCRIIFALAAIFIASVTERAAAQAAPQTIQQRFDAGATALGESDWQKAYDIYASLESDLLAKHPESKSFPIIRLRKGRALAGLHRYDDAEPLIVASLEALPEGPEMVNDRYDSLMALAMIADEHFDYPLAVARCRQAAQITTLDLPRLAALLKSASLSIFVDPSATLSDLDTAQALVDKLKPKSSEWAGLIHDYRGRALMNMGDLKAARAELSQSIKLLGGLSYGKVNLLDTAARSDAAIAALLDKEPERARELLTYAGASVAGNQGFARARDFAPPPCDIAGLSPADVAVVEFGIRDDGSVSMVRPIYFSGQRELAVEFARAVARWSWNMTELKKLEPFFRAQARIELRCTNRFKRPQGMSLLRPAVAAWLNQQGVKSSEVSETLPEAKQLVALRDELKRRQAESNAVPLAALPTLARLAGNEVIPSKEGSPYAQQAYDLAEKSGAQGEVLAWFLLLNLRYDNTRWAGRIDGRYQRALTQAFTRQAFTERPQAEAALRIALFDSLNAAARAKEGKAILEPLIASPRLENADPFRVGARIRLADLEYAAGNVESARQHFDQSGITAQQCALVDAKPTQTSSGFSSQNFPAEAMRWGFSGWSVTEFDIATDGKTQNIRTVVAFPPFVFATSAERGVKATRYEQTYRPGAERGCVAEDLQIKYAFHR